MRHTLCTGTLLLLLAVREISSPSHLPAQLLNLRAMPMLIEELSQELLVTSPAEAPAFDIASSASASQSTLTSKHTPMAAGHASPIHSPHHAPNTRSSVWKQSAYPTGAATITLQRN